MNRTLPCCFHPTTIVLIDDDKHLLDSIESCLHSQFVVKKFSSPVEALSFFRTYEEHPFTQLCIRHPERFHLNIRNIQVDVHEIYKNLFEATRFNNISVVVSDYSMPEMTGAQVFQELYPMNFKKIMFTGEASDHEGIQAFNNGVIDRFCRKSASPTTMNVIFEDMQLRYFQEKSVMIKEALENSDSPLPHCMLNPEIVSPLLAILKSKKIVEFYLHSNDGYFLTVTDTGEIQWLVVHSADEIDTLFNMVSHLHEDSPSKFSEELKEDLKLCKKTLFFPKESDSNTPIQDTEAWEKFILSTGTIFTSDSHFYYAFRPFDPKDLPIKPFICFDQAAPI
jgi:FixJ family two-component response regulator